MSEYISNHGLRRYAPQNPGSDLLLNTSLQKFALPNPPTMEELRKAIHDYGAVRLETLWNELNEVINHRVAKPGHRIRLFSEDHGKLRYANPVLVSNILAIESEQNLHKALNHLGIQDQRALAQQLKPRNLQEAQALLTRYKNRDLYGTDFLTREIGKAKDSAQFFELILCELLKDVETTDFRVGTPSNRFHQGRIFEVLGVAVTKGWLLFPFIVFGSNSPLHYMLSHRENSARYFDDVYRPGEAKALISIMESVPAKRTTHARLTIDLRNLMVCSSFRDLAEIDEGFCSDALEMYDLAESESDSDSKTARANMYRFALNTLIRARNARMLANGFLEISEIALPAKRKSAQEFASFEFVRIAVPHLSDWADAIELFIASTVDTQGSIRRTVCAEFIKFLVQLTDPPTRPELLSRRMINDYKVDGQSYRSWLRKLAVSDATRNRRLSVMSSFFSDHFDRLRASATDNDARLFNLSNPVDLRHDSFDRDRPAGTTRKAIGRQVLELMREILTENDYAWSRNAFSEDHVHLLDRVTGEIENTWCPSATILLFFLLSVPVRSIQAQLLDSGEGDVEIYDFETRLMKRNYRQLPVEGQISTGRKEGFLQLMPSGMIGVGPSPGLWISVNKTSDTGYPIPWVGEELMPHLKFQHDWILRFTTKPNVHGVIAAQGQSASQPEELQERQPKFFCLFRDPSAGRGQITDPSLPVSKQKIRRAFGKLCEEAERRLNLSPGAQGNPIHLTKKRENPDDPPRSLFDIHTLRVSGITDLLDRGVPLDIVMEYVAGHATSIMTLHYDVPIFGRMRKIMEMAHRPTESGKSTFQAFTDEQMKRERKYLVSHPDHSGGYTGFDALDENSSLIIYRSSGICPGTRCEEGGLDERMRIAPVPVGDRGPSCPQCRFWLTGPAFLLGQAIEGNQLILKIRRKVVALANTRERIIEAADTGESSTARVLSGQCDIEERQLNDMLTEWWHRMRFYAASIEKLDEYRAALASGSTEDAIDLTGHYLLTKSSEEDIQFVFRKSTDLELKHFISTCAEILPSFYDGETCAQQDIELAVGRFLAVSEDSDLAALFFKLTPEQRLTAANLTVEMMSAAHGYELAQSALESPEGMFGSAELTESVRTVLLRCKERAFKIDRSSVRTGVPANSMVSA